jgi:serine/threonine protein kinase
MSEDGARIGPYALRKPVVRSARFAMWNAIRADGKERGPKEVAIRVLKDPHDKESAARLQREQQRLSELSEAAVPHAIAWYEGHGALVMDWVSGTRLSDLLRARDNGALTLDDATILEIGLALVKVLRVAHGRPVPVVHSRLSPSNVVLDEDGRLTQLGWGGWSTVSWTIGLAPEARAHGVVEPRTDIFGLGVLLAALFEPRALRSSGISATVQIVTQRWPAAGRLLEELTAHEPAERPVSAEAVMTRLLTLARQQGGVARVAAVVEDCTRWQREGRSGKVVLHARSPEAAPSPVFPSAAGRGASLSSADVSAETAGSDVASAPLFIRSAPSPATSPNASQQGIFSSEADLWEEPKPGPLVALPDETPVTAAVSGLAGSSVEELNEPATEALVQEPAPTEAVTDGEPAHEEFLLSEDDAEPTVSAPMEGVADDAAPEPPAFENDDVSTDPGPQPGLSYSEWAAIALVGLLLLGIAATLIRSCL